MLTLSAGLPVVQLPYTKSYFTAFIPYTDLNLLLYVQHMQFCIDYQYYQMLAEVTKELTKQYSLTRIFLSHQLGTRKEST